MVPPGVHKVPDDCDDKMTYASLSWVRIASRCSSYRTHYFFDPEDASLVRPSDVNMTDECVGVILDLLPEAAVVAALKQRDLPVDEDRLTMVRRAIAARLRDIVTLVEVTWALGNAWVGMDRVYVNVLSFAALSNLRMREPGTEQLELQLQMSIAVAAGHELTHLLIRWYLDDGNFHTPDPPLHVRWPTVGPLTRRVDRRPRAVVVR